MVDIVYDNWGNATEIDRLYQEAVVVYELETSAGTVVVKEPVQWDKVEFVHKRDAKYHGFNYEYTGADVDLMFNQYSGREELMAEYALNGNDGLALFRRKLIFGAVEIIEYEGKIRMGDMKRDKYHIAATCERKSLHTLVNSRLSTKVNISKDEDLDGNYVPTYSPSYISMPGQTLSEKFKTQQLVMKQESYTETRTSESNAILYFNVTEPIYNTMNQNYNESILGISGDPYSVYNDTHNLFEFKSAGSYDFKIAFDFQLDLRIHPRINLGGKKVTNASLVVNFDKISGEGLSMVTEHHLLATVAPFNPGLQGFHYPRLSANAEVHLDVEAGDRCVFYCSIHYGHNAVKLKSVDFVVYSFSTTFEVLGQSSAEATIVSGYLIKDAMEAAMRRITGQIGVVNSDFYSRADVDHPVDGCGANRIILNGGAIRKAASYFPLTFTWQNMLESMNAIDAIGMGYEWDPVEQKENIRIEPKEEFYRDVEILELESVYEYKERVANDLIYNKLVFGYEKYKEEEENSLDEIHAYHEYLTPIKTETNDYTQLSKFNASGYLIEVTRRAYFEDDQNMATPYDDDIFIVHVQPTELLPLFLPVTDEPFDEVTGLISPDTTVNLTLSIKRMVMAHAKWLNSCLIYKGGSELVKNTFTKQNKDFSTTLKADYCKRGDEALLPLKASDDIILSVFGDFTGVYSPEWVDLKTRLNMTQVRMIMNAHRGLDLNGKNYGYISFTDDYGEKRKGYLYSLKYNRGSEECTLTLLKKKFPL